MRRVHLGPIRPDWDTLIRQQGLVYVDTFRPDGTKVSYWEESAHYILTGRETDEIGDAIQTLWNAILKVVEDMLGFERSSHGDIGHERNCYFRKMGIPEFAIGPIIRTWQLDEVDGSPCRTADTMHFPNVYGRFDLGMQLDALGNLTDVKMYEFNSDTPTALLETILQWHWFETLHKRDGIDQWNSLYQDLVDAWVYQLSELRRKTGELSSIVHVAYDFDETSGEDEMTCRVMQDALNDAARKLGNAVGPAFRVKLIAMGDITRVRTGEIVGGGPFTGTHAGSFVDLDGDPIKVIFKLFPWEWLIRSRDGVGQTIAYDQMGSNPIQWVQPIYNLVMSNKGILAVLWRAFKNDPNISRFLLETYFTDDPDIPEHIRKNHVKKPLLSREGADIVIVRNGQVIDQGPNLGYGDEGYVIQALSPLPEFTLPDGSKAYPVIGAWATNGDKGSGIAIRESKGLITDNLSTFVPHYVEPGA